MEQRVDVQLDPAVEPRGFDLLITLCDASPSGAVVYERGCEARPCPFCDRTIEEHSERVLVSNG